MGHPNEDQSWKWLISGIYRIWTDKSMETQRRIYNTYLQPRISTVEQYIVFYQCRTPLSEPNQSMGQMSRWPDLDILFSHYRRHHCFSFPHPLHFPLQNGRPAPFLPFAPWGHWILRSLPYFCCCIFADSENGNCDIMWHILICSSISSTISSFL